MEISWNFVSPKKWEPWLRNMFLHREFASNIGKMFKKLKDVPMLL